MHVNIRCRRIGDVLAGIDSGATAVIRSWKSDVVNVELQDERRAHSRQQEKFWWAIIVPAIGELWRQEKGWSVAPDKSVVHGAFVQAVFGMVDTPLGPTRRSSTTLTLDEYSQLISAAHEHAWTKYKVNLPTSEPA